MEVRPTKYDIFLPIETADSNNLADEDKGTGDKGAISSWSTACDYRGEHNGDGKLLDSEHGVRFG